MSYYIGVPLMVLLALAEVAFLPYFRVFGLQPDLLLVVLVAWLTVRGQEEVLYLAPIGALVFGFANGASPGLAFLALAPIVALHELRGRHLGEVRLPIAIAFTVVATIIYQLVYLAAYAVHGQAGDILGAVARIIVPVALLNVLALLPVYWLTNVLSPDVRRGMFA